MEWCRICRYSASLPNTARSNMAGYRYYWRDVAPNAVAGSIPAETTTKTYVAQSISPFQRWSCKIRATSCGKSSQVSASPLGVVIESGLCHTTLGAVDRRRRCFRTCAVGDQPIADAARRPIGRIRRGCHATSEPSRRTVCRRRLSRDTSCANSTRRLVGPSY